MGMYDELNKVSRAVSGQATQKKKDAEYRNCLKDLQIQLKDLLQLQLFEDIKNNENIFDIDYKIHTVSQILIRFKFSLKYPDIFKKYENDLKMYLLSNYYSIANQARIINERESKKQAQVTKIDYKQQIAFEKWEMQRQRERLKIQTEAEKLKQLQQKQYIKAKYQAPKLNIDISGIAKAFIFIMFAPFAIFGIIVYGFISAAAKSK